MAEPPSDEQLSCLSQTRRVEKFLAGESDVSQPHIMGIDEAGRGPVLGPMVYACAWAPASLDLGKREFADSKTLSADTRDRLFTDICHDTQIGYCADILSAHFISSHMLGKSRTSLNALAMESTFRIIKRVLDQGVNITHVYVDTVGDADRYNARLSKEFPSLTFTVCPKADSLYPIVSGASIVAKVVRDRALLVAAQASALQPGVPLGTGYPGDPDTKQLLQRCLHKTWGFTCPGLVRFSWETCTRVMAEGGCVSFSWEADEDGGDGGKPAASGQQQRINFGVKRQADVLESSGLGRSAFFRVRKLQRLGTVF